MRICHIITRLIVGGAQENTLLTCRGLAAGGHNVTLVCGPETGPEGSLWPQARTANCRLVTVHALRRAISPLRDYRALRDLTRELRRLMPDVVHTHSSKAGILGRWAAVRARIPIIVHTVHGMSFNRTQAAPVRLTYQYLERHASRHTTMFVSVADAMTDQAVAAGLGPPQKFVTIRSGMETEQFGADEQARTRYRAEWGIEPHEIVVGTIARLFENKGYEEIIAAIPRAFDRCPRLRFVWIGEGRHRARYEESLRASGHRDRVVFVGLVPPERIGSVINGFDVLLHASRWEGLPRAVVQALLTEVPVVSFDNDGAPEVVLPNETGMLVPYGDVDGLARAIVMLAQDSELRRSMGRRGRQRCLPMFDWRKMVQQLEALYGRLSASLLP